MNRFEWTFSGSAELVTGLLLACPCRRSVRLIDVRQTTEDTKIALGMPLAGVQWLRGWRM